MTKKCFILGLIFSFFLTTSFGQNVFISSVKLGEIKINAPIDSINKFLETKIKLSPFKKENEVKKDTIKTTYKNISVRLIFQNYYDFENGKQLFTLLNLYSEDSKIITKSGIKIGDNKFDIVKKLDGSILSISPDLERGKLYSTLVLFDSTADTMMTFYFKDNLLYAIGLEPQDEFGC
jgi:hypothetical protein